MSIQLSKRAEALLAKPLLAIVAVSRRDGSVQGVPVWFEYRDGLIWLNSAVGRGWPSNVLRTRQATILVIDKQDDHYWAEIWATLKEATEAGAQEVIDRLARRYTGRTFGPLPSGQKRVTLKLEPQRVYGEGID